MRYLKIMIIVLFILGMRTDFIESSSTSNVPHGNIHEEQIPDLDYEFEPEDAERLFEQLPDAEISPLRQWLIEKGSSVFIVYLACKDYAKHGYTQITDQMKNILARLYPW